MIDLYKFMFLLVCLNFLIINPIFSQIEKELNPPEYIKTISFTTNNENYSTNLPIIKLGEKFALDFDVLNNQEEDYYYTIDQLNFDWSKSQLIKSEYLRGFDNVKIQNYKTSFNTYQTYSHYKLKIPNQDVRIIKSGNYILKIYDEYGNIAFSRKFIVYESITTVPTQIKRLRNLKYIHTKQSVSFQVNPVTIQLNNPKNTVKTLIIQNNNLSTSIGNLKAQYTIGSKLIFNYDEESSFWGGNEYLFFENKEIRSSNLNIRTFNLFDIYHNYLFTDYPRFNNSYTYNPDINGGFLTTALNADDIDIEADYVNIHFYLKNGTPRPGESIYIVGGFNNYSIGPEYRMTYNRSSDSHELMLKLKQGFYNYKYVLVNEYDEINQGGVSGNYDETENDYKVLIYYRGYGYRYDRVIGIGQASSINITN
ncbi:uncharacterized protein METZ01_LOCUS62093 [marine metagenome]|uniref:Type 9 secretion system plug protein N-terminal domain-containing protein n=1 Tax=marine metagenome TaxID=408172 RepID=A0A381T0H6_9ZZZZ